MADFAHHPCPDTSPWGAIETSKELAPGIWSVSTVSHGGLWLSPERQQRMPASIAKITWLKSLAWYEEDIDAAWVVVAFPDAFPESMRRAAKFMLESYSARRPEIAETLDLLMASARI